MKHHIPWDKLGIPPKAARSPAHQWHESEWTDMAGVNDPENEEFLFIYGSRQEREAIKARRKARTQSN